MERNNLLPVTDADVAYVNLTWGGRDGDLPDPVRADASEAEILAFAEEALRAGNFRGIPADPAARLVDAGFRVKRVEAAPELGRQTKTFIVRPPTEFGTSFNWSALRHAIGDLHGDAEYEPVRVRLPGGKTVKVVSFKEGTKPVLLLE